MPQWLIDVLVQFPIVIVIGFVAWYAYREVRRTHVDQLKQESDRRAEAVQQLQGAHRAELADKDKQIERLEGALLKQMRAVERRLDALAKKLGDEGSK